MSLRAFHILFILLAILLSAGCAAWGFATGMTADLWRSSVSCIAVGLVVYGIYFFKKSRKLIL